jgi:hypothetical protein
MSFSTFSSFLHKLTFYHSKNQLTNLQFASAFDFSTFRLEKTADKQKQTEPQFGTPPDFGQSLCSRHEWMTPPPSPPKRTSQIFTVRSVHNCYNKGLFTPKMFSFSKIVRHNNELELI